MTKEKQKKYISIVVFVTFVFITSTSFTLITNANIGYIDTSGELSKINNRVKVCRDVTCDNPGIINFENSGGSPLVIDTEKGISGKVLGGDLGWITFNPPYGGVFFADTNTGLLKGTAWSETSGAINFSVTGQKMVIDPQTGEWNGWAWASGPYGGWVKFDCKDASCVRTIWHNTQTSIKETVPANEKQPQRHILSEVLNNFSASFINLFSGTKQLVNDTFNSLYYSFKNLETSIVRETSKINGSAFSISANNLKYLYNHFGEISMNKLNSAGEYINKASDFISFQSREARDYLFKTIKSYLK